MAGRKQSVEAVIEDEPESSSSEKGPSGRKARSRAERSENLRQKLRIAFLSVLLVAALAGIAVAAYKTDEFLASDPHFRLPLKPGLNSPNLKIEGLKHTPADRILRVFAPDFGRSVYLMPVRERRASLLAIDWIRDATVSRIWPNRILIKVVERMPVAFALLPEVALIDADGVILSQPEKAQFNLPVLLGVSRRQSQDVRRERVARMLDFLREAQSVAGQISEIDVSDPGNLIITQTAGNRAVRLMLGSRNYLSRIRTFTSHYQEMAQRAPNATLFDLRLDNRITALEGLKDGQ